MNMIGGKKRRTRVKLKSYANLSLGREIKCIGFRFHKYFNTSENILIFKITKQKGDFVISHTGTRERLPVRILCILGKSERISVIFPRRSRINNQLNPVITSLSL